MFIVPLEPLKPMVFPGQEKTPAAGQGDGTFRQLLDGAITSLNESREISQRDAHQLALGNVDNISEVMINTIKAESMIQTTVQITSRIIAAYKEVMNIQV